MAGLGAQSRRKGAKRSADMTVIPEQAAPPRVRPPQDECEEVEYTIFPGGGAMDRHRVLFRLVNHVATDEMVLFAAVQQTYDRGKWRDVVEVDTCHDVDVHLHQYSRSTDARVGDPEVLAMINTGNDFQRAYDIAYDRVIDHWDVNEERWRHG